MDHNYGIRRLLGVTIGVIFAFLIVPATRWIVMKQLGYVVGIPGHIWGSVALNDRVARQVPNDYDVQLYAALGHELPAYPNTPRTRTEANRPVIQRLRALAERHPDQASIYAYLLSDEAADVWREGAEQQILYGDPVKKRQLSRFNNTEPSPRELADIQSDAAKGEQLDPDNAYFPYMSAAGWIARKDISKALNAIHRASQKSRWNDYHHVQVLGGLRLAELAIGSSSDLIDMDVEVGSFYGNWIVACRNVAVVAIYHAMLLEKAGDRARGLAIREDLLRYGSLMRVGSSTIPGAANGIAIAHLATLRPGGSDPVKEKRWTAEARRVKEQRQEQIILAYLRENGRIGETEAVHQELESGRSVHRIIDIVDQDYQNDSEYSMWMQWHRLWPCCSIILASLFWTIVLAIATNWLVRRQTLEAIPLLGKEREPIRAEGRLASVVGVIIGVAAVLIRTELDSVQMVYAAYIGVLIAAVCLSALVIAMRRRHSVLPFIKSAAFSAAVVAAIGIGSLQQASVIYDAAHDLYTNTTAGLILVVPFVALLVTLIVCSRRRKPFLPAMTRVSCAVACVLLAAYAAVVLVTVREDRVLDVQIRHEMLNEPQYFAERAGIAWPGPTDWGPSRPL